MTDPVAAWRSRHPGVPANRLVRGWLRTLDPLARGLGRVPPDALTGLGALAAVAGALVRRPRLAAGLLVAGGVCDALDGMVAVTPSDRGRRIDHAADRVADLALAAGLHRRGAPRPVCLAAAATVLAQEGLRGESTLVTPGERPTRVVLGFLGFAGVPRSAAAGLVVVSALSCRLLLRDRWRSGR